MDKDRYELYTKGDYDVFLKNLIYLRDHVDSNRIKIRVPRIKGLHKSNEAEESARILRGMGFENIEIFDYEDDIEKHKKISEAAKRNKKEFLEKLKVL